MPHYVPVSWPLAIAKHALRLLARRALALRAEAKALRTELTALTAATSPALVELAGIGADSAAALLMSAGDNPQRLRSEAAFAALCGTNPIPASSGKTSHYHLNRGGNRQANAALHRAVVTRMHWPQPTKAYVERRTAKGKTLKYLPNFPASFASLAEARQFCAGFFYEYNYVHHHPGIAWHTRIRALRERQDDRPGPTNHPHRRLPRPPRALLALSGLWI